MQTSKNNRLWILSLVLLLSLGHAQADRLFSKTVDFKNGTLTIRSASHMPDRPKIGLVLSGGGSRGLVHVGVLKALEAFHIPVDMIVGTSVGSMIGGLYASGYSPDELLHIMQRINWNDIYKDDPGRSALYVGQKADEDRYLLSIRFNKGNPFIPIAFTPGQRVLNILSDLILKAPYQARDNFDNLRVPFRAVATDLVSGKRVVLSRGNLAESINASLAVPLLFAPVPLDSMLLVDGGLRSNLPVDVARTAGMDIVIAVDVTAHLRDRDRLQAPWEIVDQATTILSDLSKKIQARQADFLIRPNLNRRLNDDFSNLDALVDVGYHQTVKRLNALEQKIAAELCKKTTPLPVQTVRFNGISTLPVHLLRTLNVLRHDTVTASEINDDLDAILHTGQFSRVSLNIDSLGAVLLTGEPFGVLNEICWQGNTRFSSEQLNRYIQSQIGRPLNAETVQHDLNILVDLYRRNGYALMRVLKVERDTNRGRLCVTIDEGVVNELRIMGNDKTRNYVILREFSGLKGKVFNRIQVRRAIQNVYATQLYERVNTDVIAENGHNILLVKVREKPSVLLRAGGKYDTDRGAQAYLKFGDESVWGTGIKTMLIGRFGNKDGFVGLKIRDDRIFFSYFTYDLQGYYSWQVNPLENRSGIYREERRGVRFQLGRQVRRIGRLVMELRHENIIDQSKNSAFTHYQNIELRTFALRALADRRDRVDFPTKGIYNHWAWETGNRFVFETKESYTKALINLEGYYSFEQVHTWHLRMFVGIGDNSMPFSENFRLGGLDTFYGLRKNQYYGRQLVTMNVEYRYRLPWHFQKENFIVKNTYFSMRYDFGGIWKKPALVFTSDDFFSGVGVNFGVETVFGPLHLAYGRTTRGTSQLYFSLGFNY